MTERWTIHVCEACGAAHGTGDPRYEHNWCTHESERELEVIPATASDKRVKELTEAALERIAQVGKVLEGSARNGPGSKDYRLGLLHAASVIASTLTPKDDTLRGDNDG